MQNGKHLDWVQNHTLTQQNLNWFASYTQNITSITISSPAPVRQEQ